MLVIEKCGLKYFHEGQMSDDRMGCRTAQRGVLTVYCFQGSIVNERMRIRDVILVTLLDVPIEVVSTSVKSGV